jgi:hypothetical protein
MGVVSLLLMSIFFFFLLILTLHCVVFCLSLFLLHHRCVTTIVVTRPLTCLPTYLPTHLGLFLYSFLFDLPLCFLSSTIFVPNPFFSYPTPIQSPIQLCPCPTQITLMCHNFFHDFFHFFNLVVKVKAIILWIY